MISKSVQYAVWCDFCDNLEDFAEYKNQSEAERVWKALGWKQISRGWRGKWACPRCVSRKATFA